MLNQYGTPCISILFATIQAEDPPSGMKLQEGTEMTGTGSTVR
jgi:hypothetical protein